MNEGPSSAAALRFSSVSWGGLRSGAEESDSERAKTAPRVSRNSVSTVSATGPSTLTAEMRRVAQNNAAMSNSLLALDEKLEHIIERLDNIENKEKISSASKKGVSRK